MRPEEVFEGLFVAAFFVRGASLDCLFGARSRWGDVTFTGLPPPHAVTATAALRIAMKIKEMLLIGGSLSQTGVRRLALWFRGRLGFMRGFCWTAWTTLSILFTP